MNRLLQSLLTFGAVLIRPGMTQDPVATSPPTSSTTAAPPQPQNQEADPLWRFERGRGLRFETDDFSLLWKAHIQARWALTETGGEGGIGTATEANGLDLIQARTSFAGHAFSRDLLYRLELDGTDSEPGESILKDAWGQWGALRVGQGKTMFGIEGTGADTGMFFTDRSIAGRSFSTARSRGAWLIHGVKDKASTLAFGVINGDVAGGIGEGSALVPGFDGLGEESRNSDREPGYVGTFGFCLDRDLRCGAETIEDWQQTLDPADDREDEPPVWFGVSLARCNGTQAGSRIAGVDRDGLDVESTSLSLQFVATGEVYFMTEWFFRTDELNGGNGDEEKSHGFTVACGIRPDGYYVQDTHGFGLRFSRVFTDEGIAGTGVNFLNAVPGLGAIDGDVTELTGVLNLFHHGHTWKTQFEYTWQDVDPQDGPHQHNHIVAIQMQIGF